VGGGGEGEGGDGIVRSTRDILYQRQEGGIKMCGGPSLPAKHEEGF
jgi:hypothetical protein